MGKMNRNSTFKSHRPIPKRIKLAYDIVKRPDAIKRYYLATYKRGFSTEVIYYASNRLLTDEAFQIAGRILLNVRLLNG